MNERETNLHRIFNHTSVLFVLRTSANAFPPSSPILLPVWKYNDKSKWMNWEKRERERERERKLTRQTYICQRLVRLKSLRNRLCTNGRDLFVVSIHRCQRRVRFEYLSYGLCIVVIDFVLSRAPIHSLILSYFLRPLFHQFTERDFLFFFLTWTRTHIVSNVLKLDFCFDELLLSDASARERSRIVFILEIEDLKSDFLI